MSKTGLHKEKNINPKEMMELAAKTREIYERNAERFDREGHKILIEKRWLKRFQSLLPENAQILDVRCGAGEPISRYFIEQGVKLTGVDFLILVK